MLKRSIVSVAVSATSLPEVLYDGKKETIGNVALKLVSSNTIIKKGVFITLESLGSNTQIKLGNATSQNWGILKTVGDTVFIDIIDDLSKIYVIGDNVTADGIVSYQAG